MSVTVTGPTSPTRRPDERPSSDRSAPAARQRLLARGIGALYLLLFGLAVIGPLTVQSLLVAGDPDATAANVAASPGRFALAQGAWIAIVVVDVVIAVGLHRLLRHAGGKLSLLAAGFRVLYAVVMAAMLVDLFEAGRLLPTGAPTAADRERALAALEMFGDGFLVALVFFGVHLVLLGRLLCRSSSVPKVLSAFVTVAGAGYVVDSIARLTVPSYGGAWSAAVMAPAMIGEIGLALWLTILGVRRPA